MCAMSCERHYGSKSRVVGKNAAYVDIRCVSSKYAHKIVWMGDTFWCISVCEYSSSLAEGINPGQWLCGLEAINNRWGQYEIGNCKVSATSITVMEGSSDQFFAGA